MPTARTDASRAMVPKAALEAVVRAMGQKVVTEQDLFLEALKEREMSSHQALEAAQSKLSDAEATIKLLRKEAKASASELVKLQRTKETIAKNAASAEERHRKTSAAEVAALQKQLKKADAKLAHALKATERAAEQAERKHRVEVDRLTKSVEEAIAAAAQAEAEAEAADTTRATVDVASDDQVHLLDLPLTPSTKRLHSDLEEGKLVSVNSSPYGVSPATHDKAIKTVEKVWSTNPINIRTLEEHGIFVVIEYDPTEMTVDRDFQPAMSLAGWKLVLDQADLKTGENRKVNTFEFEDVTLAPDMTVTLWQTKKILDENAAKEVDDEFHFAWPGLRVDPGSEYELTLYDAENVIASSVSWPPRHLDLAVPAEMSAPSPKRLKRAHPPSPIEADSNEPAASQSDSCVVM